VAVWAYLEDVKPAKTTIPLVGAQDTESATIEWFPEKEGAIKVRIVLNPTGQNGTLFELDRSNNEWSKTFTVQPSGNAGLLRNPFFWGTVIVIALVVLFALYFFSSGRGGDEGGDARPQGGKDRGKEKGKGKEKAGEKAGERAGEKAQDKAKGKGGDAPRAKEAGEVAGKVAGKADSPPTAKQVAGQGGARPAPPKAPPGAAPPRKGAPAQPAKAPPKKRPPKRGRPPEVDKNMFSGKM
jgi:hypothetical protein